MRTYIAYAIGMCLLVNIIAAKQHIDKTQNDDEAIHTKMLKIKEIVEEAADFFDKSTLGDACSSFNNDMKRWCRAGNSGIDLFDSEGNCYLFGSEFQYLWDNLTAKATATDKASLVPASVFGRERLFDRNFINRMIAVGDKGGWISFNWNDALNYSYAKTVVKNGLKYIIFSGFYPESARFKIKQLVKSAIIFGEDRGSDALFQQINNPIGLFIDGNDYLFAFNIHDGVCFANGQNTAFVGQNLLSLQDASNVYIYKKMIDLVKARGSGWIEQNDNGVIEYVYVELFRDPRTKAEYIIGGGYYPFVNEETVISYVKRAIEHLKAQGSTIALRDFTSYIGGFIVGPLRLTVLDVQGNVLADAAEPMLIGHNIFEIRDAEGKFIVRELINDVTKNGYGWVSFVDKHSYKMTYAEQIETPDGKFIIASGFWPSSKEKSAQGLTQKAALFLQNNGLVDALHQFTVLNSHFFRGDLFVSVYDMNGICFARGIDTSRVWHNEKEVLDEKGYPIIDKLISMGKKGGGWVEYFDENKILRRTYVLEVVKPIGEMFVQDKLPEKKMVTTKGVTRIEEIRPQAQESYIVTVGYYV